MCDSPFEGSVGSYPYLPSVSLLCGKDTIQPISMIPGAVAAVVQITFDFGCYLPWITISNTGSLSVGITSITTVSMIQDVSFNYTFCEPMVCFGIEPFHSVPLEEGTVMLFHCILIMYK